MTRKSMKKHGKKKVPDEKNMKKKKKNSKSIGMPSILYAYTGNILVKATDTAVKNDKRGRMKRRRRRRKKTRAKFNKYFYLGDLSSFENVFFFSFPLRLNKFY